jgi:hypothetical protein
MTFEASFEEITPEWQKIPPSVKMETVFRGVSRLHCRTVVWPRASADVLLGLVFARFFEQQNSDGLNVSLFSITK